uniref:NAD(P)-binding domain-containing protein n=1 Tax=Craspedostauros australis TaxID=1486917 RepID=A0A7R9ZRM6_9STRA
MKTLLIALVLSACARVSHGLNIVVAGGTGEMARALLPKLSPTQSSQNDKVTVLCRNAFLAAAPNRVTGEFGYLGQSFLTKHKHVQLRDWDGGDLTDIVGQDWMGWQDDTLAKADVVINLVGGYTHQRNMAAERIVRESFRVNPDALQITVSPTEEDIGAVSPGLVGVKSKRIQECEDMVRNNLLNFACLRVEAYRLDAACDAIISEIGRAR